MGVWQIISAREPEVQLTAGAKRADSLAVLEVGVFVLRACEIALILGCAAVLVGLLGEDFTAAMLADHYRLGALGAMLFGLMSAAGGAYDFDALFSPQRRVRVVLRSWLITGVLLVTLGFMLKTSAHISREWAILWFGSCAGGLFACRLLFGGWLRATQRRGTLDVRTAIFGGGAQAQRLLGYLSDNDALTLKIVGRYDDRSEARAESWGLPPKVGGLQALLRAIRDGKVDQVLVALPWASEERIQEVVQQLALTPVRIKLAPDLIRFAYMHNPMSLLGTLPVVTLFDRPISGLDHTLKWVEDRVLGWTLSVLLSPLLLIIAVAIKLDSPGPVFFRQRREGFNDEEFLVWKFRTMRAENCSAQAVVQARKRDPRVTRIGAILRRTSLDEIPQLFNVLSGEMSVVGPRPHAPSTRAGQRLFRDAVSNYAARHRVKPGITGWAQVCGWRGPTDTEEKLVRRLECDLYYIDNWSLWFDLVILARTIIAAINTKNAF